MIKLFILKGPNQGESFDFKDDIIYIGRGKDNDTQINDKSISRRHLKIHKRGEKYFIEDLGSKNSTFVQGQQISPGEEFQVEEGRPIVIGKSAISLGKKSSDTDVIALDPADSVNDISETAEFTIYKDRPMTTLKNLELIYKVSNVLLQSLDINEILEKVLDYIFDLFKRIDRGVIILIDSKTGQINGFVSRSSKSGDKAGMMYSRTIVNRVLKDGKPIVMTDTFGQNKAYLSDSMKFMKVRSVICVPLKSNSKIRGVIYVDSLNRPYGFRKEDLSLLNALSGPAAIAVENVSLYSNLEKIIDNKTKSLKKTEKKLRESEARFKAMFDNMSSGVIVYEVINDGDDFIILDLNKAARKIEKVKKKEVLDKKVLDIFPSLRDLGLLELFKRIYKTGKPEHHSVTLSKDGEIVSWREYYIYQLPTSEIVTIYDDVTGKKKVEAEQRALQKQLFVSQKMESIGAFAGGTAHNFRNILQAIQGNIEYLEMIFGEKPEIKDLTKSIYNSVEKGVDLINSLLHFAMKGVEYELTDVDMADVIMETYEIIDRVFSKNIEIILNLEKDLFVSANRSLLSQVFMNLFTNARDAMPDGGKLFIEGKKKKDKVVAIVTDTGYGMDKETLEKVFDPFFTAKDVGKGTGLGLSTSHGIIEQHKGRLSVSSKPGKGSSFTIQLPLAKTKKLQKPGAARDIIFGNGQKVLIIDDERPVLDTLTELINRLGYEAIPVNRSVEALENYNKWTPDVVLMDRSMPELDGVSCIKKIVKADPDARIVIVSGYDESGPDGIDEDVKGLIKGYLTKPCGKEELGRMISQALET
ncbi:MAG: ATP-binding protein [Thermodesulfobacteriota bacterium]|nr:ATP-binding protein [Thermodesulfobacteriota bacterium]